MLFNSCSVDIAVPPWGSISNLKWSGKYVFYRVLVGVVFIIAIVNSIILVLPPLPRRGPVRSPTTRTPLRQKLCRCWLPHDTHLIAWPARITIIINIIIFIIEVRRVTRAPTQTSTPLSFRSRWTLQCPSSSHLPRLCFPATCTTTTKVRGQMRDKFALHWALLLIAKECQGDILARRLWSDREEFSHAIKGVVAHHATRTGSRSNLFKWQ